MQDLRTPPGHDGSLVCPHCAHAAYLPRLDVMMPEDGPQLGFALLRLTCRACGQPWDEIREGAEIKRYWTPRNTVIDLDSD